MLQPLACAGPARASGHTDGAAQGACTDLRACLVVGELALGGVRERDAVLASLTTQREAVVATHAEVMTVIDRHSIFSMGIGYTDAHLLTSTLLDRRSSLWTRDKRPAAAARKDDAALYPPAHIPH
ncbi:type II toxin-antitoxin system VapC family toxin [Agrobacterium cavarae]|uniref:type II toxin-antitoxin system VapC family toxin n=1 Tax=Agrobacterium cavarae TaxID=2528239 RepID=UPI003FCFEC64